MKSFLILLAFALLGLSAAGCGDSSGGSVSRDPSNAVATATAGTSTQTTLIAGSTQSSLKRDRDNDEDHNTDDGKILGYGHAANAADQQALTALVKGYYRAAAAEEGAKACSLLYPFIAESVAENYNHAPALRGETCAAAISRLFKLQHRRLVGEGATLKVFAARVDGDKALVVLSFATVRAIRLISARRYGHTWKLLDLFDYLVE